MKKECKCKLKLILCILTVAAIAAGVVYFLFKKGILPLNREEEIDFDELDDFDEDLSDLFDDFNDAPIVKTVQAEEAPAEEVPAEE